MSRAAASSQTPQNPIWQLTTKLPKELLRTCRTQQLDESSFQIDESVLTILTQFLLNYDAPKSIATDRFARTRISIINWINILNIALGFGPSHSLQTLRQVAAANLLSRNQLNLLRPAGPSLFPVIPIHINQLIEAILHGDEKMVRDIVNAAPELLLKKGIAIDLQGRPFTGTPLQAAIAVDDIAPNANSTGTVELILEKLKQFDPDKYHAILEEQACELYKENLEVYVDMQNKEIARLCKLRGELPAADPQQTEINKKIKNAQENVRKYLTALRSEDLNPIFETHKQAQADNAFDFQPYADAILNAPQTELGDMMAVVYAKTEEEIEAAIERTGVAAKQTDECRRLPFNQLTLVQKLNRFREEFAEYTKREIIFNPHHILTGLKANEAVWDTLQNNQDPNYEKRSIIFSRLCGFAQRLAPEPVKQDIRQGTWYLTEQNKPRSRRPCFNTYDPSYYDPSYNVVMSSSATWYCPLSQDLGGGLLGSGGGTSLAVARAYVEQKQQAFRTYYAASAIDSQLHNPVTFK